MRVTGSAASTMAVSSRPGRALWKRAANRLSGLNVGIAYLTVLAM